VLGEALTETLSRTWDDRFWSDQAECDFYRHLPARLVALLAVETTVAASVGLCEAADVLLDCAAGVTLCSPSSVLVDEVPASQLEMDANGDGWVFELALRARGRHVGVLTLRRRFPFTAQDRGHARTFAELAASVLDGALIHEHLAGLANTDQLTGVPNRRALLEELGRRAARGGRLRLAMLDVDGLKRVNDRLGYRAGNELICALARTLDAAAAEGIQGYRLAGDEFVCLLPDCDDAAAGRLHGWLVELTQNLPVPARIRRELGGVSVGLVSGRAERGADQLLERAERAMRRTKRRRKTDPQRG
jgi:diguanylate cyclase (GGDEF)-like protein